MRLTKIKIKRFSWRISNWKQFFSSFTEKYIRSLVELKSKFQPPTHNHLQILKRVEVENFNSKICRMGNSWSLNHKREREKTWKNPKLKCVTNNHDIIFCYFYYSTHPSPSSYRGPRLISDFWMLPNPLGDIDQHVCYTRMR